MTVYNAILSWSLQDTTIGNITLFAISTRNYYKYSFGCCFFHFSDGTACFKNLNNYLNTHIYSYLETSGGQSFNLYLSVVHFLTPVLIKHLWQLKTIVFLHMHYWQHIKLCQSKCNVKTLNWEVSQVWQTHQLRSDGKMI